MHAITNVVFAGLGGMGVITASDILATCALRAGLDVKKSEVHGMSQRGGSVTSEVRFGGTVFSPMVPEGGVDLLVALDESEVERSRYLLRAAGKIVTPHPLAVIHGPMTELNEHDLPLTTRNFNVALLGIASVYLPFPGEIWESAIAAHVPDKAVQQNREVFRLGRRFA